MYRRRKYFPKIK